LQFVAHHGCQKLSGDDSTVSLVGRQDCGSLDALKDFQRCATAACMKSGAGLSQVLNLWALFFEPYSYFLEVKNASPSMRQGVAVYKRE
jgi:hypothetical protein